MSDHPLIVLEGANSGKLQMAYLRANRRTDLHAFVLDMKDGEPVDQEAIVRSKAHGSLVFVAIGRWGHPR